MNVLPLVYYFFGEGWSVGYSGNILADWKARSGDVWTVPIGVSVGKVIKFGMLPVQVQIGVSISWPGRRVARNGTSSFKYTGDSEAHKENALPITRYRPQSFETEPGIHGHLGRRGDPSVPHGDRRRARPRQMGSRTDRRCVDHSGTVGHRRAHQQRCGHSPATGSQSCRPDADWEAHGSDRWTVPIGAGWARSSGSARCRWTCSWAPTTTSCGLTMDRSGSCAHECSSFSRGALGRRG